MDTLGVLGVRHLQISADLRVLSCRSSCPLSVNWEDLGRTHFLSINVSVWSFRRPDGKESGKQSTQECLSSAGCLVLSAVPCVSATAREPSLANAGLRFSVTGAVAVVGGALAKEGPSIVGSLGSTGRRNHALDGLGPPSFSEVTCLASVLRRLGCSACIQQPFSQAEGWRFAAGSLVLRECQWQRCFYFRQATQPVMPR